MDDTWLDEHGKVVKAIQQNFQSYPKKLDIEFVDGDSKVIDGYDNIMKFAKTN